VAAADDKQKGNAKGFSGLATLVSDVEDNRPASKPASEVSPPPSNPPHPAPQPTRAEQAASAPTASQPLKGTSNSSSDVATGKWMVGIGLAIGLLLIIFVNSTKHESTRLMTPSVAQAPTTAVPAYQPPSLPSVTPRQKPPQEASIQRSATESVNVLGQQVGFSNPSGYCTPGKSAREVELMDLARRSLGEGSRLVHSAVRCSELEDYRNGRRDMLDHWLQIQLIGPKGNFQRIEMTREAFLSSLSKSSPRVKATELNRRLKASFENSDISLSNMKVEPIGRDGNAVYFSMRMDMIVGEASRPVTGISGITLLNSLPLSINVYEGTGSPQSRGQLQAVQQELLNSLLTEN